MDPSIGRFTSVDPLAEKYYSISPYAYVANNPMKYVDLRGNSLTHVGSASDLQAVDAIHNQNLGGYYTVTTDTKTGLTTMTAAKGADTKKMTASQKQYHAALDKVINGTDGMTSINVVRDSEQVPIGVSATQTIDIGDIEKIGEGAVSSGGALMHETWEQYKMQVGGLDVTRAHIQAVGLETAISGKQRIGFGGEFHYDYSNLKTGVKSSTGTIIVPLKNTPSTLIYLNKNNVTRVIR